MSGLNNPWRADPKTKNIIKRDKKLLSVAWDADDDPEDLTQWKATLYWSPFTDDTDHDHIIMTQEEARELHEWLGRFLKKVDNG